MNKMISLIKASMTQNMNIFKVKTKSQSKRSKALFPVFLTILVFFSIWSYANMFMEPLVEFHLEYVLLTLFILVTFILTLTEGIYKTSSLLFNCTDDQLMFSLPIKRRTVLFIRIFKFYVFELLYNSLFLLPAMVVYIRYVNVDWTYYLSSIIALLVLPIIPVALSCFIGAIISGASSRFKSKNLVQILISTVFLLFVFYISFNLQNIVQNFAQKAQSVNEIVTKLYYPAGAYLKLVTDFKVTDLLVFILIHVAIFAATVWLLSKVYFKINSRVKSVKVTNKKNSKYSIKTNKPIKSLIKKELNRFINSPVFVTNAAFGLVLFVIACLIITFKFDGVLASLATQMEIQEIPFSIEGIKSYMPLVLFGTLCFGAFMSSITSSMISLEGKSFNILKSLPVSPVTIINAKVLTAVVIMIPFFIIGDLIMFIEFQFNIFEILMLLIASVVLPLVAETIGIIVNLKYPKMDAQNDTQVVKQSMSSMIAVFIGMGMTGVVIYLLVKLAQLNIATDLIILGGLAFYTIVYICLLWYLNKKSVKDFNMINV